MPIIDAELLEYRSATVNDGSSNGGRLSATAVAAATANNVWPDVPLAERTAGSVKWRKVFEKVANAAGLTLQNAQLYMSAITPGDDYVHLAVGTQRDTQGDLSSPRLYGAGELDADASSSATEIDVATENGSDVIFVAGDDIWISDGTNSEFATIDTGGVSYAGDVATLTLTAGLTNAYLAATPTVVASVIDCGNIAASVDNYAESSASGTFDEAGNPVTTHNIGTIEQTWTLTFSDASNFSVSGDTVGSVGSGSIAGDFSPTNASFGVRYFTIPSAAWGGTWANGETLVFQTHPAAFPLWIRRTVPAGAGSLSGNDYKFRFTGESA